MTDGCTGKTIQDEYLHKSDMLGIVGWIFGGVEGSKDVGEMVESTLAERVGLIIGRRVVVETVEETVVGSLVRDEISMRLEIVAILVDAKGDCVSETGKVDVLDKMALGDEEEDEAMLENTGGTVDGERLTLG